MDIIQVENYPKEQNEGPLGVIYHYNLKINKKINKYKINK